MRTLKVTLEIKVDDWTPEFEEDEAAPCTIADYEADEVADVLDGINENTSAELFAGSEIYAVFKECRVMEAAWLDK
jgi:hypothetical protein